MMPNTYDKADGGVCRSNVPGSHPSTQAFPTERVQLGPHILTDWKHQFLDLVLLPYQTMTDHFLILILYCRGRSKGIK